MRTSESIAALAAALAKAQAEMQNPAFDSNNPFFKSKYASLAAVRNAVIPALSRNNLAIVQTIRSGDNIECETMLMHASGEWLSDVLALPVAKHDPQGYISASTYARRASLQSIVCVVGDDDDDGNEASKTSVKKKPEPDPVKPETVSNAPTLSDCLDNISLADTLDDLKLLYADALKLYPGSKKEIVAAKDARKLTLINATDGAE